MNAKKTDLKELEGWYEKSGNQLMLLYGGMDCRKEQLIKEFCVGKKYFYYRCRQLSAQEQMQKMGEEIQNAFQMKLSRYSYDEFFNRVKSGDASLLSFIRFLSNCVHSSSLMRHSMQLKEIRNLSKVF